MEGRRTRPLLPKMQPKLVSLFCTVLKSEDFYTVAGGGGTFFTASLLSSEANHVGTKRRLIIRGQSQGFATSIRKYFRHRSLSRTILSRPSLESYGHRPCDLINFRPRDHDRGIINLPIFFKARFHARTEGNVF